MADTNQLWIVTETEAAVEQTTGITGERSGEDTGGSFVPRTIATEKTLATRKRVALDAQTLKVQMENMIAIVNDLFSQADTTTGLRLDEVELSVEINAEGQISLVGNGGKLGNSGGITLKFTRPQ